MVPKSTLKKMFVLVLDRCLNDHSYQKSSGIDSVIPHWIQDEYDVKLAEEDILLLNQIAQELMRDGFIVPKNTASPNFCVFTNQGRLLVEDYKHDVPVKEILNGLRLESITDNQQLINQCNAELNEGTAESYWRAVRNATVFLEDSIRKKAELSNSDSGVDLINKAFNPVGGVLKIPSCGMEEEEKGFHLLLMGVMKFHRNAKGHRTGMIDRNNAIRIIVYIDYLLRMINSATKRI